ncbi:TetR/AcrR family transcriptional regulator [Nocardioides sp. WG-D5]|uniref:TetR/AcrR family transcriptional regulator n=1 Tax=Nocardioides luteus TaxID=1844 RepID=UPI00020284F6|nr:TetR/AcrR family transcriptional regulator [Nocardioides luteus]EGD41751.1 transcriptional regulator, TetR family [Nocardioidaceae bacterium Broad-1]MBG6097052.1 AcrR family transcriptional regulator [Nocardioides luteus]
MVQSRDAERTRSELLEVATEVFSEQGYSGARVDEIAERTRTTKRMIYYYFGGKEGLFLAVLEAAYRRIRDLEQSLHAGDLEPVDAIRRIAELTFDHHVNHPDFIRLVSVENIHRGRHLEKVESLRELGAPAASVLDEVLARGRASGELRADVDAIDVHMMISAYCVFQVANSATFGFLFGRDMLAPDVRERHRRILGDIVVGWLTAH